MHLILKGAYSAVITPEGKCWFNSTGNSGMATGDGIFVVDELKCLNPEELM